MSNSKPTSVKHAEFAIWATLVVSALVAVIDRNIGAISPSNFMGTLVTYALLCIIPYKIGQGSNATRYIYAVIVAMTLFMLMAKGVSAEIPKLDVVSSYLMLPVEGFILYSLFRGESSSWFSGVKQLS